MQGSTGETDLKTLGAEDCRNEAAPLGFLPLHSQSQAPRLFRANWLENSGYLARQGGPEDQLSPHREDWSRSRLWPRCSPPFPLKEGGVTLFLGLSPFPGAEWTLSSLGHNARQSTCNSWEPALGEHSQQEQLNIQTTARP